MKHGTFTEVYESYATLILKSVVAQTKNIELAEEICQQTFLKYYKNIDKVDREYVKAWLFEVAKNLLIDYGRKASTRNEMFPMEEREMEMVPSGSDMEEQCVNNQFLCGMLEDLKREKPRWYDVIYYLYIMELSQEETAKRLGITPSMLRSRLYRAKKYIREKYGGDF